MLFNTFLIAATLSIGAVNCATPTDSIDNGWTSGVLQKRHAIIGRLRERVSRSHLSRRASAPACPFARDNEGNCCPNNALETDGDCCPPDIYYSPLCASSACCEGGQVYRTLPFFSTPDSCCRSPSTVYTDVNGNEACCPSGIVAGTNCCTAGQIANGGVCQSGPAKKRVKRNPESSSVMVQRRDQSRMLLSPDLVAEHLLNNGVFEHEGEKYVDHNHQAHNDGFLRRLAGKGMYQAMKYVFKPGRVYDADRWNSVEFIPISEAYEFAVKDVPEIYARIVAKEDFDVFHWSGAAFDRDILYRLASGHPTFNESLVNLYR